MSMIILIFLAELSKGVDTNFSNEKKSLFHDKENPILKYLPDTT